jgi:voltage-gated potassium channel
VTDSRFASTPTALDADARRDLILSVGVIVVGLAVGTLGYMVIEDWNAFDALYMTVITLATIGYGEVHPLSDEGRLFTIVLIGLGVALGTVVLGVLGRFIVQTKIALLLDRRRTVQDRIQRLTGHTIFCGFSRLARVAAAELVRKGEQLVVLELDDRRAEEAESAGLLVLRGDSTDEELLVRAGVERASRLVSLLPRDSDNLYVILTGRELNPKLYIVSRAEDEVGERRLRRAGVNRLVSTYSLAARKLADGLLRPHVTDFFEAMEGGENGWKIEQITVPEASAVRDKPLAGISLAHLPNIRIAGIVSPDGVLDLNPGEATLLPAGATLIAIGRRGEIAELERLVGAG